MFKPEMKINPIRKLSCAEKNPAMTVGITDWDL